MLGAVDHPFGLWSVVPPALAIILAIVTRQVFLSLFAGIAIGYVIVEWPQPIAGVVSAIDACRDVFADRGQTSTILFSIMVGSLIALIQRSGGIDGFVHFAQGARLVRGRRSAGLLTMAVGMATFIESSIVCLVTGAVGRPIFDRLRISREKLAYVCDTVSAPTCVMIPLNGWGAFILMTLTDLGIREPVPLLIRAIPFNFYAILSLLLLLTILVTRWDFGPMRAAERRADREGKLLRDGARPMISEEVLGLPPCEGTARRAINMMLPIAVMVAMVPVGLSYTGYQGCLAKEKAVTFWNVLGECSGATAVLWAVLSAVVFAGVLYRAQGIMRLSEWVDTCLKGASALLPLGLLMMMAFAIGRLCKSDLQTGHYVASVISGNLPVWAVAPLVFVVSCAIAFATGTSWGTFAIMLAIAVPLAQSMGAPLQVVVAAVLGGGVFGDHCSPISDTTIVSSMASASDHIDHVRTQLPYALAAGVAATLLYLVAGLLA